MYSPKNAVIAACAERVHYCTESGALTWKPKIGSDRHTRAWNTRFANKTAGHTNESGYVYVSVTLDGVQYWVLAHRVAWYCATGRVPEFGIDHIDGDPSNNSISNLRDVPQAVNTRNNKRYSTNTSGVSGVRWNTGRKKWEVNVGSLEPRFRGYYTNKEDAASAVKAFRENNGYTDRCNQ